MKRRIKTAAWMVLSGSLIASAMLLGGSISCTDMAYKSTVTVGTTNPQTAFYAALVAVNNYHYPFAVVDPAAGVIKTGEIQAGSGRWYAFDLQVHSTGEVQIDTRSNMEKATQNGVIVPEGIVERAAALGKYIRKYVTVKTDQEISLQGETILQAVLQAFGGQTPAVPVVVQPMVVQPVVAAPAEAVVVAPAAEAAIVAPGAEAAAQ